MLRLLMLIFLFVLVMGCMESQDYISYSDPCILADSNAFYIIKSEVLEPGTGVVLSNQLLEKYDYNGTLLSSIHLNNEDDYYSYSRKMFLKGVNDTTICLLQKYSYKKEFEYSLYADNGIAQSTERYYYYVECDYYDNLVKIIKQSIPDGTKDTIFSFLSKYYSEEWKMAECQFIDKQSSFILYSGKEVTFVKQEGDSCIKSSDYKLHGTAGVQQNDSTLILAVENALNIYSIGIDTFNLNRTINLPSGSAVRFALNMNQNIVIYEKSQYYSNFIEEERSGEIVLYNIETKKEKLLFTNEVYDYGY